MAEGSAMRLEREGDDIVDGCWWRKWLGIEQKLCCFEVCYSLRTSLIPVSVKTISQIRTLRVMLHIGKPSGISDIDVRAKLRASSFLTRRLEVMLHIARIAVPFLFRTLRLFTAGRCGRWFFLIWTLRTFGADRRLPIVHSSSEYPIHAVVLLHSNT